MKITLEEIKKTAKQAKIAITEDEAALYTKQLSAVLNWVEELQSIDTSSISEDEAKLSAPFREDKAFQNSAAAQIKAAFNDSQDNYLKVKKVL
ncbi:MAG: Asp-tRNA(Asn)/Glu-tRNA(Gln) amidotransferase subunit GatC [Elusimicrobiota bacterium]|jgi:aspartyl-tRNA(Asn)/glutamyl-tRNA(Gln) amidotransferase subunit C|nr:Asp-tRNA(Asn)/Glu-tRNA(Gln) amidotransferase subunit GatC [Elusimicrobiota bacterium]